MGDLELGDDGESQYVMAFDLTEKKRLWTSRVGKPHRDGSRCTPTVEDGRVYAIGTDGDLVCVEAATGKELWRRSFSEDFGGRMMSGWKYSESPLIDGDKLICTPGGPEAALVALNKKTGEVIWKCAPPDDVKIGGAGYASVAISEGAGVRQYTTVMGRGALGVAASDGQFLWFYPRVANGTANIATPVTCGDYVFVSTAYGTGSALLKLEKAKAGVDAKEVYWLDEDTFQCHHGGFLRNGDYIYGAHGHSRGNPICIEWKTGKVLWSEKQPGGGSGALLLADGHLYFRYQDNTVALMEADPEGYKLKSTFKLPKRPGMGGPGWAHPAIADGKLYLRHRDVLFCYNVTASKDE
jgi:outer membrane protein assembly factor BamB